MNELNIEDKERQAMLIQACNEAEDGSFTLTKEEYEDLKNNPIYDINQAGIENLEISQDVNE